MIPDYDKALYYTLWGQWDELLVLMVRTDDDFLSKKIEQFLNAFHYSLDEKKIMRSHDQLLYYLDHAMRNNEEATIYLEI
ncbi:YhdB family protein [Oceanobacillus alkalisoli]|uniref:YhdB family protein n=1 Tax=Oceanobacillus alkalisoli TaxID=2925113 RepID=UPI001F121C8A|nr:YhdB family protein [Oceanobacillus alkalisoli]MCF3942006.1 YhdB family protein [Oceanobacillus alkalisoli]